MGNAHTNCTSPIFNESGNETTGISFQSYLDEKNKSVPQVGHIKLLSYNIFVRPPMISNSGNDYKDQRLEEFTKFFHGYDIICLQEMFSSYSNRRKALIQKAENAGFLFSTESPKPTTLSKTIIDGGLLILSRYPIAATEYCPYPAGHGSDHYVNKGVLYAKVQIGNSHLHVYTTHAQATYDTTAKYFLKRTEQFMCFRKFIKATLARYQYCDEDLVLLAGDFNVNGREHSRFHSKDTSVLSVLQQFSSLRKGHIFSEYDALISCLTDDHTDEIDDLLYLKYGEHPITLGDYYVTNINEKLPKDNVLTHPDLFCVAESLDYIFKYTPNAHSPSNPYASPNQQQFAKKPKLYVKDDSAAIEKFFVTGQDFGQLSDHYGATVTIEYTHGESIGKEAETAASTPSNKYSLSKHLSEHFPKE